MLHRLTDWLLVFHLMGVAAYAEMTAETMELRKKLHEQAGNGILFGHQDATAYGVGWQAEAGRSDVKDVCGAYPAVYGWDLGDIHKERNIDGVRFADMKQWISEADARGGINTISLHLDHPVTGRNAWDNTWVVEDLLPGGSAHDDFLKTWDLIAAFLNDLRREDGTLIPIIFRPYHEHSERWPWWGRTSSYEEDFVALWRMTVDYLRDAKGIHHLLYAISPQDVVDEKDYMDGYPGDAYVDIFGLDYYKIWNQGDVKTMGKTLSMVAKLAERHGKISALTETGIDKVPVNDWWTGRLLAALNHDEYSRRTVWALVWRNKSAGHHFGPFPGHVSADDFIKFYEHPLTEFQAPAELQEIHALQKAFVAEKLCLSNVATVVQKGKVLHHLAVASGFEGDRPITDETIFPIWSMTKPITSVAAMILYERGAFKLDDPASNTIPELANFRVKGSGGDTVPLQRPITYRDLLRHTSGIDAYDGSFDQEGTWKEVMELDNLKEVIGLLEEQPLQHQPGERYTYGMSTAVMGRVIELISGQSFATFLEKELFEPLGMKHTRFYLTEEDRKRFQPLFVKSEDTFRQGTLKEDELYYKEGSALALGGEGLVSTIKDYGHFCQMLVDRGHPILKRETLDLMLTDELGEISGYGPKETRNDLGIGFYISKKAGEEGAFGWGGYHNTHFWIDPNKELYAIFLSRMYPSSNAILGRFRKSVNEVIE